MIGKTEKECYTGSTVSQASGCRERKIFVFDFTKLINGLKTAMTRPGEKAPDGDERKDTMFDTMKVAKQIREARIAKNMTQMNLADAMGVSYQAVSNWERGNSMPDISKLEDLCRTLDITISELLGMDTPEAAAVNKVMEGQESLTVEELGSIAPMLPPEQMKQQAERTAGEKKRKFNLSALTEIALYLDDEFLEELVEEVEVESLAELEPLAMYLDEELLDKLVRRAPKNDIRGIVGLASYLSEETLGWVVRQCDAELDRKLLEGLGCYLDEETLDALADKQIARGNVKCLSGLYCYMDSQTVRKIAKALMAEGDMEALRKAAPFM